MKTSAVANSQQKVRDASANIVAPYADRLQSIDAIPVVAEKYKALNKLCRDLDQSLKDLQDLAKAEIPELQKLAPNKKSHYWVNSASATMLGASGSLITGMVLVAPIVALSALPLCVGAMGLLEMGSRQLKKEMSRKEADEAMIKAQIAPAAQEIIDLKKKAHARIKRILNEDIAALSQAPDFSELLKDADVKEAFQTAAMKKVLAGGLDVPKPAPAKSRGATLKF